MSREIRKKIPKGHKRWLVSHKENKKNRKWEKPQIGWKEMRFKKSRHRNSPRKQIPTKPWWSDGPGQSGMKTLTSIDSDSNNIVEDLDHQKH